MYTKQNKIMATTSTSNKCLFIWSLSLKHISVYLNREMIVMKKKTSQCIRKQHTAP